MSGMMGGSDSGPTIVQPAPTPAPTPRPTAPMPDALSPGVVAARQKKLNEAAGRGGRASTILTPASGTIAADYSGGNL